MDTVTSGFAGVPGILAAMPAFLENLDGGNLIIGIITLGAGLLGLAYIAMTMIAAPLPQTEQAEPTAYPSSDRLIVPLLLPIGVALVIALVILLMSQILLVVPEAIATPIALGVALLVLIVCSIIANAPRISRGMIYTAIGIPLLVLILAGGASGIYRVNQAQQEAAARAQQEANAPSTTPQEITTDNKFSKTSITVPAGQQITLNQINNGLAIHNWHVLDAKDASGKDITTELTQPGQKSSVSFTISSAGTYKFQCDVHPTEMIGQLKVVSS
jgi:plastocyanin